MIEYGPTSGRITHEEAWLYCLTLEYNGHKDWIMPTEHLWIHDPKIQGWYEEAGKRYDIALRPVIPIRIDK